MMSFAKLSLKIVVYCRLDLGLDLLFLLRSYAELSLFISVFKDDYYSKSIVLLIAVWFLIALLADLEPELFLLSLLVFSLMKLDSLFRFSLILAFFITLSNLS